ncbi:unnamed protein product [Echinostoma caproni]|uniref:Zinc finger protein n=1 Tax=Echinostoma caproni TaxID=27848 RepID=A0A183AQJ8_9TREM|nr:unnamed protein product [Echinostoma caproni]
MCICPVCGFSASSPRGQDEHMETEHGECHNGASARSASLPIERLSPGPDVFVSSSFGLRASSTPHQQQQAPQQRTLPTCDKTLPVTAMVGVPSTGLSLPHTTSLPYFSYDLNSPGVMASATAGNDAVSPTASTHSNPVSMSTNHVSVKVASDPDTARTGMKTRTYRGSLGRHTRIASVSKLMDCESPVSNVLFPQKVDSRRRYRCNICPATFPWHGDLTEHLRLAHGMQKTRESARSGKAGNFCCNHCKYVAKYQSELRRHMRLHWGVKPFVCVFCPYRSAWKGDLKRHMESHHRERFSSEADLVEIMSQFKNNAGTTVNGLPLSAKPVTDAYNFGSDFESETADEGSYKLQDSQELSSSGETSLSGFPKPSSTTDLLSFKCAKLDSGSVENPLICTICSYKAQNQSKLHNHMAGHMNLKPFKCPICDHRSNYKWDVRKHLRSQHPTQADLPVVVLSGLDRTGDIPPETPLNLSPPDSPMSLCIDLASKTPEQPTVRSSLTPSSVAIPSPGHPWSTQSAVPCEPDPDVVPIDLSVKDQTNPIQQPTLLGTTTETNVASTLLDHALISDSGVIQHTVSSLVDSKPTMNVTAGFSAIPMIQNVTTNPPVSTSAPSVTGISWTSGLNCVDQSGLLASSPPNTNAIGLILNLQQQLLMHGLLPSWPPRPISTVISTSNPLPPQRASSANGSDHIVSGLNLTDVHPDPIDSNRIMLSDFSLVSDPNGVYGKKTPSEWSSADTDPSELMHAGRNSFGQAEASENSAQETPRRTRGRKLTTASSCYNRPGGWCWCRQYRFTWTEGGTVETPPVAHPERTNITTVTLDLEEAKQTFGEYMNRLKMSRSRYLNDSAGGVMGGSSGSGGTGWTGGLASTSEGYYRPYKCSVCGHRSNWKWDVRKHIKQMHNSEAEVITLSLDEARRTIHQYKSCRRQQQTRLLDATALKSEPQNISPDPSALFPLQDDRPNISSSVLEQMPLNPVTTTESTVESSMPCSSSSPSVLPPPPPPTSPSKNIPTIEHNLHRAGDVVTNANALIREKSYTLYYPCRQCGRRFRSYPTLFFHMHHKHHAGTALKSSNTATTTTSTNHEAKLGSVPPLSIRFYYAVSRNFPRHSSRMNRSKCPVSSTSNPAVKLEDHDAKVSDSDPARFKQNVVAFSVGTDSATITDDPQFTMRNPFQRDRVLRARRRTCENVYSINSHSTSSPLRSFANQDNANPLPLLTRVASEDRLHSVAEDLSPRTVRQLTELLDKVLSLLEGKIPSGGAEVVNTAALIGKGNGEVVSHLANLIEERLSRNEKSLPYTGSKVLDTSASSNEENQPLGNTEPDDGTISDRSLSKILHHPEVERRFLRLASLLHTHGHRSTTACSRDLIACPRDSAKRFRPTEPTQRTNM